MIFPPQFAEQWVDAWNRRDLEALLIFYAETIELRSPFAKIYAREGAIRGKPQLRAYWTEVMRRVPSLRLELVGVYSGHKAMSLHYRDNGGRNVIETMLFDEHDKITHEAACLDKPR